MKRLNRLLVDTNTVDQKTSAFFLFFSESNNNDFIFYRMNRRVLSIASAGIASSIFAARSRQRVEAKDYLLSPEIEHNFDLNWDKLKPRSGYR